MKLISAYELAGRPESDLHHLFREVSRNLVQTDPGTFERRNALASLENIVRARADRL